MQGVSTTLNAYVSRLVSTAKRRRNDAVYRKRVLRRFRENHAKMDRRRRSSTAT